MYPRFLPVPLLKILVAAFAGLLLAAWLRSVWPELRSDWVLAAGVVLGAIIGGAGVLLRSLRRDRNVDLSASELTTLTFPPEGRLQRSHRR